MLGAVSGLCGWLLTLPERAVAVVILAPRGLLGLAERVMRRKEQSDV